jgi:hypothetical protein
MILMNVANIITSVSLFLYVAIYEPEDVFFRPKHFAPKYSPMLINE